MTQISNIVLFHINAIDQHAACLWVIESHYKADKGGFSGTRLTNDSNNFIGLDYQVKALKDPLVASLWVAEPHILELNLAPKRARCNLFSLLLV